MCWFKPVSNGANYGLLMQYSTSSPNAAYMQFFTSATGVLQARIHQARDSQMIGRKTGNVFSSGAWTHAAFTWSGGTTNAAITIYCNGAAVDNANDGSGVFTAPYAGSDIQPWIGAQSVSGSPNSLLNGGIQDVGTCNVALTADEIKTIYKNGVNAPDQFGGRYTEAA